MLGHMPQPTHFITLVYVYTLSFWLGKYQNRQVCQRVKGKIKS